MKAAPAAVIAALASFVRAQPSYDEDADEYVPRNIDENGF